MMMHDSNQALDDDCPRWLEQALSRSLVPPRLPPGLLERVQQAARTETQQTLQQRIAVLEADLTQARQRLARHELQDGLQVLGMAVAVSFATGALAAWTLPLWSTGFSDQAVHLLPLLALGLGACTTAWAVRSRWGRGGR
jgi:D-serine deaminase-like pyridoxal phosphate-dependent protein